MTYNLELLKTKLDAALKRRDSETPEEAIRLREKMWMNSFYMPCASKFFYFYDKNMQKKIREYGMKAMEQYLEENYPSDDKFSQQYISDIYVSKPTAMLLRDKRFHVRVHAHYENNVPEYNVNKHDWNDETMIRSLELDTNDVCSAPTHEIVLKWLREIHQVYILTFNEKLGDKVTFWCRVEKYQSGMFFTEYQSEPNVFDRYEDATEDAITYTLKNIL